MQKEKRDEAEHRNTGRISQASVPTLCRNAATMGVP